MWTIFQICLQSIAIILLLGSLYLYLTIKPRAPKLENSELVELILIIEGINGYPIKIYLPTKNFIDNMDKSLERHLKDVRALWETEKERLKVYWPTMNNDVKKNLLTILSTELSESVEPYAPIGWLNNHIIHSLLLL